MRHKPFSGRALLGPAGRAHRAPETTRWIKGWGWPDKREGGRKEKEVMRKEWRR